MRYLSVHNAENKQAHLQSEIVTTEQQITRYDVAQQRYQLVSADQQLLTPIVTSEVYWPSVLTKMTQYMPQGGVITTFSGSATPLVPTLGPNGKAEAPPPHAATQIASVVVSVTATNPHSTLPNGGYDYFESWTNSLGVSNALQLTAFTPFALDTHHDVVYSATLGILGTVESVRINKYQVLSK